MPLEDARWWTHEGALSSMLDGFGFGYWARDIAGDRLECSDGCAFVLGLEIGKPLASFAELRERVHPEDRPRFDETVARALERGHPYRVDHRIVTVGGRVRWIATRCGIRKTTSGKSLLAGITLDITAQKELEEERNRAVAEARRASALLQQMPLAVVVTETASGRLVMTNAAVERVFPPPLLAQSADSTDLFRTWAAFHADGTPVEDHERPFARARAGETVMNEELRVVAPDGRQAWLQLAAGPVRDDKGAITHTISVGANIDGAKRAEEALRASQSQLRQLFESPVIGIIHIGLDGAIKNANDTFLQTFGYSRDDLAEGRLDWVEMTPPEYRALDRQGLIDLQTRRSALLCEKEFLRKDGSRVPIALGSTMVEASDSEAVTFVLDISDRKKSDRERERLLESLALSEERYRLVAMATQDAIYDWDMTTDSVRVHALFGPSRGPISTVHSWVDSIHPSDRERIIAGLTAAIQSGAHHWESEYRYARGDGSWLNIVDRAYLVRDSSGTPVRMVGAMQDVTSRRAQEDFERQLIGIVSHDLKNPLQTVLLAAEMLSLSDDLSETSRKSIERIQAAARRSARLIRDLLDFTRARLGGGIPIEPREVYLTPYFETLLEEVRAQHPGRAIEFEARGDLRGEFDADRLGQVLTNLVENALKYSPRQAPVRISLCGDADTVVLTVHNQGAPIPTEQQARIFEPMQRGEQTIDPTGRSVGLGLYIVKQLVEAHGGSVELASSAGEGTTFTVRLRRDGRRAALRCRAPA